MDYDVTKQNVIWFVDRARNNELSLEEPYQRRPVWRLKERCFLIESILLSYPIPELYIRFSVTPDGEQSYAVVDGQQRIRSVLKFVGIDDTDSEDNGFALTRIPRSSRWYGKTFSDLSDDEKKRFYEYSFSVRELKTADDAEMRTAFVRLNKFSMALKAQELRNARFTGPFIQLATDLADDSYMAQQGIFTPSSIRRMGDVEFVGELLAGIMYGPQDGSAGSIDKLYEELDEEQTSVPGAAKLRTTYAGTIDVIRRIAPDLSKTIRWQNKHDFYSLFVALSSFVHAGKKVKKIFDLKKSLERLEHDVSAYIQDENTQCPQASKDYARAVQKGPSSKARRGARHAVLVKIVKGHF